MLQQILHKWDFNFLWTANLCCRIVLLFVKLFFCLFCSQKTATLFLVKTIFKHYYWCSFFLMETMHFQTTMFFCWCLTTMLFYVKTGYTHKLSVSSWKKIICGSWVVIGTGTWPTAPCKVAWSTYKFEKWNKMYSLTNMYSHWR